MTALLAWLAGSRMARYALAVVAVLGAVLAWRQGIRREAQEDMELDARRDVEADLERAREAESGARAGMGELSDADLRRRVRERKRGK